MVKKDYKIYLLTFPNKNTYVGHTSQKLNQRYYRHCYDAKIIKVETLKSKLCLKHKFNEVEMVEVDRIFGVYNDAEKLEQKWINNLNPTLNTNKSHRTEEDQAEYYRQSSLRYHRKNKELILARIKIKSKTPIWKLTQSIYDAKRNIKKFTKQNRPNMVLKWEGLLEERIQNRLIYQSN